MTMLAYAALVFVELESTIIVYVEAVACFAIVAITCLEATLHNYCYNLCSGALVAMLLCMHILLLDVSFLSLTF